MIVKEQKYAYKDLTIVPAQVSDVESRNEVTPYDDYGYLPIFTAPMSCVVNENNYKCFEDVGIHSILPTTVDYSVRKEHLVQGYWVAMSMAEAALCFLGDHMSDDILFCGRTMKLCIDVANGHMKKLLLMCKRIKNACSNLGLKIEIMTGNIANPYTVLDYLINYDIDYVRVGIGGGSGCTTTSNVGCHYPMGSLIAESYGCKNNWQTRDSKKKVKIVADGGIRNYDDVNKALALGADYVMIGGLFTEMIEAASQEYEKDQYGRYASVEIPFDKCKMYNSTEERKRLFIEQGLIYHEVYGMSTKRAQEERGLSVLKTSEGTSHYKQVKYTLKQWTDNMTSYLKSIMSYCNARKLEEFVGKPELVVNTYASINSVNK